MSKIKVDAVESRNGTLTLGASGDTVVYTAGSIPNSSLDNSAITINGTAISLGSSGTIPVGIDWQSSIKAANFTAVAGEGYFVNTTSGAITATLPASPSAGDQVAFKDYAETFGSNALTIARNGSNIQGAALDSIIETARASVLLVYADATKGWLYTVQSNAGDNQLNNFIVATGGTITTDGDFKVHTFTSSGTFTVTDAGNPTGSTTVDYTVVAAGGSGGGSDAGAARFGGGGGGAGGFRQSFPNPATAGFPVSAQGYPITIGAGGAGVGQDVQGNNGGNSVFSSITSTGGGGGGRDVGPSGTNGNSGGSGAGGGGAGGAGGAGNTPSVSPPQGNPGGSWPGAPNPGGGQGGGGASAAGSSTGGGTTGGAPGGNGTANSITGSSVTRSGGGGGGSWPAGTYTTAGAGGSGGGGAGASASDAAVAGTANTGGGGGGAGGGGATSAAGGSGVVIIRYKFQ